MGKGQEQAIHRERETNSPQICKKMLILTGKRNANLSYLKIIHFTVRLAENKILMTLSWQGCGEIVVLICIGGRANWYKPHPQQFGNI